MTKLKKFKGNDK